MAGTVDYTAIQKAIQDQISAATALSNAQMEAAIQASNQAMRDAANRINSSLAVPDTTTPLVGTPLASGAQPADPMAALAKALVNSPTFQEGIAAMVQKAMQPTPKPPSPG